MFADDVLPATLRVDPARLDVRLNWYRSLPLSCVEAIELAIDGEPVPDVRLRIHGFEGPVGELGQATGVWWPVLEAAELLLGDVTSGEHEVDYAITLRIPYYGPLSHGGFVTITEHARRKVTA
jgi:Domain of unknown function (DUF6379)